MWNLVFMINFINYLSMWTIPYILNMRPGYHKCDYQLLCGNTQIVVSSRQSDSLETQFSANQKKT